MSCKGIAAWTAAVLMLAPGSAVASDIDEALAVVQKFTTATDREAYGSYCAQDAVVIDHVPPYVFRGSRACQEEWDAVIAWTKQNDVVVSDYGTPSKPSFTDAADGWVYAVYPVTAAMTIKGQPMTEPGTWTFVLRKSPQGWRIQAWTWATLRFAPAHGAAR